MNRYIGLTVLLLFATLIAKAQICTPDTSMTNPGLEPMSDSLDCFVRGDSTERTVFFKNFDTIDFSGLKAKVEWIEIEHVYNLPCGINWTTNKADANNPHRFQNLEEGCIQLTGVTNDPPGQYKLEMRVKAKIGSPANVEFGGIDADTVGLRYDVRVKENPGDNCPAVDTTITGDTTSCPNPNWFETTSIENQVHADLKDVRLSPNPLIYQTKLSFYADFQGTYQYKLLNTLGEQVRAEPVEVDKGRNQLIIKRGDLQQGLYIFKLTDKHGSLLNKKLMVNER